MEISGILKNAERIVEDDNGKIITTNIFGQLFNDTKGRGLKDGEYIVTSRVQEELPDNIFKTLNSYYKVEFAEKETA